MKPLEEIKLVNAMAQCFHDEGRRRPVTNAHQLRAMFDRTWNNSIRTLDLRPYMVSEPLFEIEFKAELQNEPPKRGTT